MDTNSGTGGFPESTVTKERWRNIFAATGATNWRNIELETLLEAILNHATYFANEASASCSISRGRFGSLALTSIDQAREKVTQQHFKNGVHAALSQRKSRVSADRPCCRVLAQSLTRSASTRRYICVPYLDSSTGSRVTHVYDEDREPGEIKRASLSWHRVRNAGFISATITRGHVVI